MVDVRWIKHVMVMAIAITYVSVFDTKTEREKGLNVYVMNWWCWWSVMKVLYYKDDSMTMTWQTLE